MSDSPHPATSPVGTGLLQDIRVCLVFEYSLSHSTRLLQEIEALRSEGATVELLTSHPVDDAPEGVQRTYTPRSNGSIAPSARPWRPARIADNLIRNAVRPWFERRQRRRDSRLRLETLASLSRRVDIFWVIDAPSLPPVVQAVKGTGCKIVYETVDLVPEYHYWGDEYRQARLEEERRALPSVSGFITACDSYADYYWERYGGKEIGQRPFVRDNMPAVIVPTYKCTSRPLKMLFLGSLMFDRPITELIEAVSLADADVTLTFQGKNLLEYDLAEEIERRGLEGRVILREPCAPEDIVDVASGYDVGVVALRGENENERRASTSKLFTYMSAGLAILGTDLPGIARVVSEYGNGLLASGIEPATWARKIEALDLLSDGEIDDMKRRSLEAAHEHAWERQRSGYIGQFVNALNPDGLGSRR